MSICMIIGNWKMNTTVAQAEKLARAIGAKVPNSNNMKTVICPPFISITAVQSALGNCGVSVGAQNLYHEKSGAYTGEISPSMLAGICEYVIIGHSERRSLFKETDRTVNLKIKAAIDSGIKPILCIGESLEQRNSDNAEAVIETQLRAGLEGIDPGTDIIVAYEPVWAIGTGHSASPEIAQSMMAHIRRTLREMGGRENANGLPLLYGGSVNAENIAGYMEQPDINGALVGGASLDADSFLGIVRAAAEHC